MAGRKDFTVTVDEKEIKLATRVPLQSDVEEAQRVERECVARMIRDGKNRKLLLRVQLEEFLKEQGIWTDADAKKIDDLKNKIVEQLGQLRKGGLKLTEGRAIAIEITDNRMRMLEIMKKRQAFDDTTVESTAEAEREDYLVWTCTVYADTGKNYWNSLEDMKADKFSDVYMAAQRNLNQFIYGFDSEFERKLPENQWLKKYNFVDDELRFIDRKTGKHVTKNGQDIEDVQKKANEDFQNLQGEIVEEAPFIDEDGTPVIINKATVETA